MRALEDLAGAREKLERVSFAEVYGKTCATWAKANSGTTVTWVLGALGLPWSLSGTKDRIERIYGPCTSTYSMVRLLQ